MAPDSLSAAVGSWNRDQLRLAVSRVYEVKGFVIDSASNLPHPVAFLSRSAPNSSDISAVGCIAVSGGQLAAATEIQLFWQRLQERRIASGVLVTNGQFEPAAIQFAAQFPLLLIDGDGLLAALTEIPTDQRSNLLQAVTTMGTMAASAPTPASAPAKPNSKSRKPEKKSKAESAPLKWNADSRSGGERARAILRAAGLAVMVSVLGLGGYVAASSEPVRERLAELGTTLWNAGPFADQAEPPPVAPEADSLQGAKATPIQPAAAPDSPPPAEAPATPEKPKSVPGHEPDLEKAQMQLVHRVRMLEDLKSRIHGEQSATRAVTVDRLALELGIDFVAMADGDLERALNRMTGRTGDDPLPPEFAEDEHIRRQLDFDAEEILPYLTIVDGRIELDRPEVDIDKHLSDPAELATGDSAAWRVSLKTLDRQLYIHESLEARRRAQSIAGVVGSARAAGIDFIAGKTDIESIIDVAIAGAKVRDEASSFHGVEFRVPEAFTKPKRQVAQFLRIEGDRLVFQDEPDPSVEIDPRFATDGEPNEADLGRAIDAAEGLIRAANLELMVQRELKLDRLLAPVSGLPEVKG